MNNAYMSSNPVQSSLESEEIVSPEPLRKLNLQLSNAKLRHPNMIIGSSVKKATVFAYREASAVKSQDKHDSAQKGWLRSEGSSNGKNLASFVNNTFVDEQPTSALTKFAENDVLQAKDRNIDVSTEKALQEKHNDCAFNELPTPDHTEATSSLNIANLQENGASNLLPYFGHKGFDEELELRSSSRDLSEECEDPAALRSSSYASASNSMLSSDNSSIE